jgi:subtilisin
VDARASSESEDPLLDAMRPQPTGDWIVTFNEDVRPAQERQLLSRTLGLDVPQMSAAEYRRMGSAAQAELSAVVLEDVGIAFLAGGAVGLEAARMQIIEDDSVLDVRPEFWLFALQGSRDDATRTWGLDAVGAERSTYTGEGIRLCVLDTGIDAGHPDFTGRISDWKSFVGQPIHDVRGHGTHCAGTAFGPRVPLNRAAPRYGVAPGVAPYVGKVLNDSGAGREREVIAGMLWAITEGCEVISMSLGRPVRPGEQPSPDYERLGRRALAAGSLIIAAAGNDSRREYGHIAPVSAPANSSSIMAVAAVDTHLGVAHFSNGGINPGSDVDIAAPGVSVFSSLPLPRSHGILSGTSMACPHVAGVAALWAETSPSLRGRSLWQKLLDSAKPLVDSTRDVGSGLVQAP